MVTGRSRSGGPQLIAYADRLGGDLAALRAVMERDLGAVFDGVHLLPFYRPHDGADAGFDPEDHASVDPRLGDWDDVAALAGDGRVMADLIVNHMSTDSDQFRRFLAEGERSPQAPMFLTLASVFPDGATEEDLARIYRPRPGLPFTPMTVAGRRRLVWTTFTPQQVDLDVRTPQFWSYLTGVIDALVGAGVSLLRLDAVGYTGKSAGTDCFMTPASFALVDRIAAYAHERGAEVLLEVHGHHLLQVEIAGRVDHVYDFALPPLFVHAWTQRDLAPLADWLRVRPDNSVTVLDTHDGIGIIDVGPTTSDTETLPGLLTAEQVDALVEAIHEHSGGTSRLATGAAASNLDLYQVNCTYYDALGADDDAMVAARLVQLYLPGIAQVYYVGLLAGRNDVDLLRATGVGRDVNRTHVGEDDLAAALEREVVRRQLAAIRFRSEHPAFGGSFSWRAEGDILTLGWSDGEHASELQVDVGARRFSLTATAWDTTVDALPEVALGGRR